MINYESLIKKPGVFPRFFGLSVEAFDKLMLSVEAKHPEFNAGRRTDRVNAVGAGRPYNLGLRERVLMFLLYYRQYVTQELAGFIFGLHESNVCCNLSALAPLMEFCLPTPARVYRKARRASTLEEFLLFYPDAKIFVDATKQEIPRPKHKRRRKSHYSGKKKKHTVKTQITVNKKGLILHNTRHARGSKHDLQLFREQHPVIPPDVEAGMDLGYLGVGNYFPRLKASLPVKRKKGRKLTCKQKKRNRTHGRQRVIVENTLCRIKKFDIIGEEYRNNQDKYDEAFSITAGLVNLQTMQTQGIDFKPFIGQENQIR